MELEIVCEECEQAVDKLSTQGPYFGVCVNCEQELRREDAHFMKDHQYEFGDAY